MQLNQFIQSYNVITVVTIMSQLHHCSLERERTFIFGGLKQIVALLRIRIKQLEVELELSPKIHIVSSSL